MRVCSGLFLRQFRELTTVILCSACRQYGCVCVFLPVTSCATSAPTLSPTHYPLCQLLLQTLHYSWYQVSPLEDDASLSYTSKHLNHSLPSIPFVHGWTTIFEFQIDLDSVLTAEVAAQLAGELKPHKERSVCACIKKWMCHMYVCMYVGQ